MAPPASELPAPTPPQAPPTLTVAAVARRLGVAPATLRTWDRRYGLGPSQHRSGAHRRYAPEDLARLETMRRLTRAGVAPAEAARVAAASEPEPHDLAGVLDPLAAAELPAAQAGGGRVIAMPSSSRSARGLARAAMALDATTATEIVKEVLRERGMVWTWEQVLVPVLEGVGRRWETTGEGVEVEHLLSECIIAAVHAELLPVVAPRNARAVVLAAAAEEQHTLPLYAIAAGLAERGIATHVFGARLPSEALADAVRRSGPAAVFVWSHLDQTGDPFQLSVLPSQRPAPTVVVGGPGWRRTPHGTTRALDLEHALELISEAVGDPRLR